MFLDWTGLAEEKHPWCAVV